MEVTNMGNGVGAEGISRFVQLVLQLRNMATVHAVEAARWLDAVGLLEDSPTRRGLPLRRHLRAKAIRGQRQMANRRWFIDQVHPRRETS